MCANEESYCTRNLVNVAIRFLNLEHEMFHWFVFPMESSLYFNPTTEGVPDRLVPPFSESVLLFTLVVLYCLLNKYSLNIVLERILAGNRLDLVRYQHVNIAGQRISDRLEICCWINTVSREGMSSCSFELTSASKD